MNYTELIKNSLLKQDIDLKICEIPFNIFMKNNGDILTLCFIECETEDSLVVAETTDEGFEELRIIPKDNIEYVSIFYDFESIRKDEKTDDNMFA